MERRECLDVGSSVLLYLIEHLVQVQHGIYWLLCQASEVTFNVRGPIRFHSLSHLSHLSLSVSPLYGSKLSNFHILSLIFGVENKGLFFKYLLISACKEMVST